MSLSGGRPFRKSGSGREDLPDIWDWSRGPLECPVVVVSLFRMSGSGRENLPDVSEWSGGHP